MWSRVTRATVAMLLVAILAFAVACAPTMETVTSPISVPYPEGFTRASIKLDLAVAHVEADATGTILVEGGVAYNAANRTPEVTISDNSVLIRQGGPSGVPSGDSVNDWTLHFGREMPFSLEVVAGAYSGTWELGGLPLTSLTVTEGAASSTYSFSAANPEEMVSFDIAAGAGMMRLVNMANANFEHLKYSGGAGGLLLDLGGELTRNGTVVIDAGAASVTIVVPGDTPARVSVGGGASGITADDGFQVVSDGHVTPGWVGHDGPGLEVQVNLIAGSLSLTLK